MIEENEKKLEWYQVLLLGLGYGFVLGFLIITSTYLIAMFFDTPFALLKIFTLAIVIAVLLGVPSGIVTTAFFYYFFLTQLPNENAIRAINKVSLLTLIGGVVSAFVGGIISGGIDGCLLEAVLGTYGIAGIAILIIGVRIKDYGYIP